MKKTKLIAVLASFVLLAGCGIKAPEKTASGEPWDKSWVTLGSYLGVENPEGFTVNRSEDALAAEGMFYTTWSSGDEIIFVDQDKKEVKTHDAEIHLLTSAPGSAEKAEKDLSEWKELMSENYPDAAISEATYLDQEFEVLTYELPFGADTVLDGAAARCVRGELAIWVDVTTAPDFEKTPTEILEEFLLHCHYAN